MQVKLFSMARLTPRLQAQLSAQAAKAAARQHVRSGAEQAKAARGKVTTAAKAGAKASFGTNPLCFAWPPVLEWWFLGRASEERPRRHV